MSERTEREALDVRMAKEMGFGSEIVCAWHEAHDIPLRGQHPWGGRCRCEPLVPITPELLEDIRNTTAYQWRRVGEALRDLVRSIGW